jgi:hypothetical protein
MYWIPTNKILGNIATYVRYVCFPINHKKKRGTSKLQTSSLTDTFEFLGGAIKPNGYDTIFISTLINIRETYFVIESRRRSTRGWKERARVESQ